MIYLANRTEGPPSQSIHTKQARSQLEFAKGSLPIYIIYKDINGLPQLESLFWSQCGFELTMFRSEDSCANQLS